MEFVFKYRGKEQRFSVPFESTTLEDVGKRIEEQISVSFRTQKLLGPNLKGLLKINEHSQDTLESAGIQPGKKYTLLGSTPSEIEQAQPPQASLRIRSFEDELRIEESRRRTTSSKSYRPPNREYTFDRYEVLRGPHFASPDTALQLLYRLANDVGICGIMEKHKWKVGLLSEMPPEGKVGISRSCVLGYNVNNGQEIALRLRTDDLKGFRKYKTIRDVLIHELAHMVWSDHDENFKNLNAQLSRECNQFINQYQNVNFLTDDPVRDEQEEDVPSLMDHVLGGKKTALDPTAAARDAALKRLEKRKASDDPLDHDRDR